MDQLDVHATIMGPTSKDKSKLSKGLEQKAKPTLDSFSLGLLDSTSEEIMDIVMETFESPDLLNMFKGGPDASRNVTVEHITINQDYSHITVWWSSSLIVEFTKFMGEKQSREASAQLHARMTENVTKRLQSCEGVFRKHLRRRMDFKKLPRIFFRPHDDLKRKERNKQQSDMRQQFLRDMESGRGGGGAVDFVTVEEDEAGEAQRHR